MAGAETAKAVPYVPEPRPAATDYLLGALHFPGWRQGLHGGWQPLQAFPERTPLLGYYDEGDPEVTDWEIKWALEHGITFFVYCWYRKEECVGKPVNESALYLQHAIHEGHFHARYGDRFRFALLWENDNAGGVDSLKDLENNLMPYWIEHYFSRPNYLKVDNRPVLFVYRVRPLLDHFGSAERVRELFDRMRELCRDAGFDGIVLPAGSRFQPSDLPTWTVACGLDYAFAYGWHMQVNGSPPEQIIRSQLFSMTRWQNWGQIPLLPTASMGWDPRPWQRPDPFQDAYYPPTMIRWQLNPSDYRTLLVRIRKLMADLPEDSLGRRMLLLDNWNEWGEGHYLAPHRQYGFGYIQAVREVFTKADNEPDHRLPQELGLGPYDKLWQAHRAAVAGG